MRRIAGGQVCGVLLAMVLAARAGWGADTLAEVRALLAEDCPEARAQPEKLGASAAAKPAENSPREGRLLQTEPERLLDACQTCLEDCGCAARLRLLVLEARTGTPRGAEMAAAAFETLSSVQRLLAARMLRAREDPRTLRAAVALLARADSRARAPLLELLNALNRRDAACAPKTAALVTECLRQPSLWGANRPAGVEMDGVIGLLCDCPSEAALCELHARLSEATPSERAAIARAAARTRGGMAVSVVRALLADDTNTPSVKIAACRAAGELADREFAPTLIALLAHKHRAVADAAHAALQRMSGETHAPTPEIWQAWLGRPRVATRAAADLPPKPDAAKPNDSSNAAAQVACAETPQDADDDPRWILFCIVAVGVGGLLLALFAHPSARSGLSWLRGLAFRQAGKAEHPKKRPR